MDMKSIPELGYLHCPVIPVAEAIWTDVSANSGLYQGQHLKVWAVGRFTVHSASGAPEPAEYTLCVIFSW